MNDLQRQVHLVEAKARAVEAYGNGVAYGPIVEHQGDEFPLARLGRSRAIAVEPTGRAVRSTADDAPPGCAGCARLRRRVERLNRVVVDVRAQVAHLERQAELAETEARAAETAAADGRPRPGGEAKQIHPRVSVVIPALNEAKNLPYVFGSLPDDIFEVVVVDGHSSDGTIEVARALRDDVRIVAQDRFGKGNALACGFAASTGDVIVMLDADGSANPKEIPRFVEVLRRGVDFAKGSRFIDGGGSSDITRLRRLGNWFFSRLVNLLFGTRYSDLCYGYNAFWVHCLPHMNVDSDGFEVETLINIRVARAGLKVAEVPSFEENRIHGESNLRTFRDGFRVLRTILREWRTRTTSEAHYQGFPPVEHAPCEPAGKY